VSPIFGIAEHGTAASRNDDFEGEHTILLLGPVPPFSLPPENLNTRVWIGLGLYNVILAIPTWNLPAWISLTIQQLRHELWQIRDGEIAHVERSNFPQPRAIAWRADLLKVARHADGNDLLADSIHEYCTLMASAISRCELILPTQVDDLALANNELLSDIEDPNLADDYVRLAQLTDVNAALSRFTSQSFSGSSPVFETECHFWIHSLLGTGVANLALTNLERFVRTTLGAQRLHARFDHLRHVTENVPNLRELRRDADEWTVNYLLDAPLTTEDLSDPIFPVITYLSGRDGFKSTEQTLSAPLAVISSCNSMRWSLMTLTHEISHIFIKGFLGTLYFDSNSPTDVKDALRLRRMRSAAPNLLDEIRRYLLFALLDLERVERRGSRSATVQLDLALLLDTWHHEVEELFVHVFDFLYFYGRSYTRYVHGIWTSWGVVPNIANRVPEYVMRTLCVLLSLYVRDEQAADRARETLLGLFKTYCEEAERRQDDPRYVATADEYLRNEQTWLSEVRPRLISRLPIVRIAQTFFYSQEAALTLGMESHLAGGSATREGYPLKIGRYDTSPITNPLKFIEQYTDYVKAAEPSSAWLLHVLAFNVVNDK